MYARMRAGSRGKTNLSSISGAVESTETKVRRYLVKCTYAREILEIRSIRSYYGTYRVSRNERPRYRP